MLALVAFLAVQQPAPVQLPPSPIARLAISPGNNVRMNAQDTLRLVATPLDSAGKPVAGARVSFFGQGGRFESSVSPDGLVESGATGSFTVMVTALVPGTRPLREIIKIAMVAGPATRVAISPAVGAVMVGQRLRFEAKGFSKSGDPRIEAVAWTSSAPTVAAVRGDGIVEARAVGAVRITARMGTAEQSFALKVRPNTITSLMLAPEMAEARTGDVVRLKLVATDRAGHEVTGFTPQWSFSPGQGMIDPDGAFIGYEPGTYLVTASFGHRSAEGTVTLKPRDVRRPATVVGRLPRTRFTTEEVWIHPGGKVAYLGSGSGGDVLYAIDISDPSKPTVTDSIITNTRRVNDVMSTPDGKYLVFTREGASDRKNGIVIASTEE